MTTGYIWNYKLPSQKNATEKEFEDLTLSVERAIKQDDGKYIYTHKVLFCLN